PRAPRGPRRRPRSLQNAARPLRVRADRRDLQRHPQRLLLGRRRGRHRRAPRSRPRRLRPHLGQESHGHVPRGGNARPRRRPGRRHLRPPDPGVPARARLRGRAALLRRDALAPLAAAPGHLHRHRQAPRARRRRRARRRGLGPGPRRRLRVAQDREVAGDGAVETEEVGEGGGGRRGEAGGVREGE
ncbi:hypothetical protein LTR16_010769, partial [Cryomyces antarcticus]